MVVGDWIGWFTQVQAERWQTELGLAIRNFGKGRVRAQPDTAILPAAADPWTGEVEGKLRLWPAWQRAAAETAALRNLGNTPSGCARPALGAKKAGGDHSPPAGNDLTQV